MVFGDIGKVGDIGDVGDIDIGSMRLTSMSDGSHRTRGAFVVSVKGCRARHVTDAICSPGRGRWSNYKSRNRSMKQSIPEYIQA